MLKSLLSYLMAQSKYIWNDRSNILCTWFDQDNYLPQSDFLPGITILMVRCLAAYSLAFACEQAINSFFAEYEMKDAFPQNLHRHPKYISTWRLLTAGWGFLSISQALLRLVLLYTASPAYYYMVSSVYGGVRTPLFLVFSFWFPK